MNSEFSNSQSSQLVSLMSSSSSSFLLYRCLYLFHWICFCHIRTHEFILIFLVSTTKLFISKYQHVHARTTTIRSKYKFNVSSYITRFNLRYEKKNNAFVCSLMFYNDVRFNFCQLHHKIIRCHHLWRTMEGHS